MTSSRPYLIRALYEWIVDNHLTPHVLVNATSPNVNVPKQYVKEGRIVLNIGPNAVEELLVTNQAITFSARFNEGVFDIYVPSTSVLAIYASENGRGMFFSEEDEDAPPPTDTDNSGQGTQRKGKPILKVVK
ncbi:MAG: ClpXP protease specificity-enhancing factor [Gammaproteobacteria bacterium]|jgi:stringent starvation protein B